MSQLPMYPPQQHDVVGPDSQGTPARKITRPWLAYLQSLTTNVVNSVTHTGALVLNRLIVGNGGQDIRAEALNDGQIPIGATSDGTVIPATITAGANISVTNGAHSIIVAATGVVTGPAGSNKDLQYNDSGVFGGDANLTWDKTTQQQAIKGNGQDSTLLIDGSSTTPVSISGAGLDAGISVGSEYVGGVQIAKNAVQGYMDVDQSTPKAVLGLSTGETPGSPTTYAQFQEIDVFADRSADVVGDDTAGAIPGKSIGATRNAAGAGAASTLHGQQRSGTDWYIWQDATGAMRYGPARPTEDNSVSDTSGTQIGTGDGTVTHTAGALTANELLVGNGSADIKTVAATDGQIPIGKSSDGSVTLATLTAGANITITNAGGSITIAASGGSTTGGSTLIGLDRLLGDGSTTTFNLADLAEYVVDVSDAGSTVDPTLYTLSSDLSQITFGTAPTAGHVLTFEYVVAQLAA